VAPRRALGTSAALARTLQTRLGADSIDGPTAKAAAAAHLQMRAENTLGRLREMGGAGRWTPEIELTGMDHLHDALDSGRGAVLWRMAFTSAVAVHMAIAQAGVRMVHLSQPAHGAGAGSSLGYRHLGPGYSRAEAWHLKKRVLIPEDGTLGYMKELMGELKAGGTLSIFGEAVGLTNTEAPLLGQPTPFAQGAPSLAHRMKAPLLLQHARWVGPGRYEVTIDAPLDLDRALDRGDFVEVAVQRFAARLDERVRAHPESWTGW